MDYLTKPIAYLDGNDFDDDGNIVNSNILNDNKPVFIMIQANFCGFCKMVKPDFQMFAENNPNIFVATIQADCDNVNVQKLMATKINKIYPNLVGFPSYLIYASGKRIIYNGGRTLEHLQNFTDLLPDYLDSINRNEKIASEAIQSKVSSTGPSGGVDTVTTGGVAGLTGATGATGANK